MQKQTHVARAHEPAEDGDLSPQAALRAPYHLLDDLFSALLDMELFRCAAELERWP